jgi:2-polyprenyl-6-methoxyphenol hydroxylase-like FAD-dependent oxidoreductase
MSDAAGTCIVGGGPAGMMLGYLLARAGRPVVVLEKHKDFFRDFRGDTIHPSTLEVIAELGLLEAFLAIPHDEVREIAASVGGERMRIGDFRSLPTRCKMLALMPQWDFLNFIAERARAYPHFQLRMEADVTDLLVADERVIGVRAHTPNGDEEFRADLVIGADGRSSIVRERAGLYVHDIGAPMDVLWFRLPRKPDDPEQALGCVESGKILVLIGRTDYWQCGYVIPKDGYAEIQRRGIDAFRADLTFVAPFLRERANEIHSWDDVRVLTVKVDRLDRWYRAGLLCIGDAAHAMSPIGGIGINLAIQDAVAAANILTSHDPAALETLQEVQRRRELPTRVTQAVQVFVQQQIVKRVLAGTGRARPPFAMRLLDRFRFLRFLPAYAVGIGVRPEHVRSPAAPRG